jgi:FMN phosphatase YigB (HAD superfamily)
MKKKTSSGLKIFLDFDDVLFNTKAFKGGLINVFKKNGVSEKDFLKTYKDYPTVTRKGLKKYDPFRQIRLLEKKLGIDGAKTERDMLKFLGGGEKFVFPDVKNFLRRFGKKNLFLVSYGHTGFQDKKIENCSLAEYFQKVVVTDKMKAEVIKRLARREEKFFFLDDRADQIEEVKKNFPQSATFLVKRKEGRYNDRRTEHIDYVIKNLKEGLKILKKLS